MEITDIDLQFFSAPRTWGYGPMYATCMFFKPGAKLDKLDQIILAEGNITRWQGAGPKFLKSIMQIDMLPSVGLVHNSRSENEHCKYPQYSLAIYPPQYTRLLEMPIHSDWTTVEENWTKMDPTRIRLFHAALFLLICKVNQQVELLSVSINTEDRPMRLPFTQHGSICLSPSLAGVLGLRSEELPDSSGFFISAGRIDRLCQKSGGINISSAIGSSMEI